MSDINPWSQLSPTDYKRKKHQDAARLIKRLEAILPGLGEAVELRKLARLAPTVGSLVGWVEPTDQSQQRNCPAYFRCPSIEPVSAVCIASVIPVFRVKGLMPLPSVVMPAATALELISV